MPLPYTKTFLGCLPLRTGIILVTAIEIALALASVIYAFLTMDVSGIVCYVLVLAINILGLTSAAWRNPSGLTLYRAYQKANLGVSILSLLTCGLFALLSNFRWIYPSLVKRYNVFFLQGSLEKDHRVHFTLTHFCITYSLLVVGVAYAYYFLIVVNSYYLELCEPASSMATDLEASNVVMLDSLQAHHPVVITDLPPPYEPFNLAPAYEPTSEENKRQSSAQSGRYSC